MTKHLKEIAEKVESGEYFIDAREWYFKKYLYHFVERSYLILILLLIGIMFLFTKYYKESLEPIVKHIPIAIKISDTANLYSELSYLGNAEKDFDINEIAVKFYSKKYVQSFEEYYHQFDFQKLKANLEFIKNSSSDELLKSYESKISIRNVDSMILKYRKNGTREIVIEEDKVKLEKVKSINSDTYEYNLNIGFVSIERINSEVKKSNWVAKIDLTFQDIKFNKEKGEYEPINIKVLNYESKIVN